MPEKRPDWVEAARVTFPSGRHADELCVTEVAQVVWAANLAVRSTSIPGRRAGATPSGRTSSASTSTRSRERRSPTGSGWPAVVRETLEEIGYVGWPKTSGNRGIHIAVRIEPNWEFPVVRRCALAFAREIERRLPTLVTTAWWKEERGEKVFIDYNQNARDRTIASAYSVRPRPDATVSAPVTWDELPDVETEDFTMSTMPERFAGLGDVQAGDRRRRLRPRVLLEWVERDEKAGRRGGAVPAELPEDAGRAAARAALARRRSRATADL